MKKYCERLLRKNGFDENCILPFSEVKLLYGVKNTEYVKEKVERLFEIAEEALNAPLIATPVTEYIDYYDGKRGERLTGYDERRHNALALALAESIERKGRFTRRCLDNLWGILEELTWVHPAHLKDAGLNGDPILPPLVVNGKAHGVDLRTGFTSAIVAMIYYLIKDELDAISPVINERIKYTVRERLLYPYIQRSFWWTGENGGRVINWGTWISANILFTIAVLEDDEYLRHAVVRKVINTLDSYTYHFSADGGCDEGPSYWGASTGGYLNCLDLLYDLSGGKINVYSEPFMKGLFEFVLKMNICESKFLCFADAGPDLFFNGDTLIHMGEVCGSENLKTFGKYMNIKGRPFGVNTSVPYNNLRSLCTPKECSETYTSFKDVWLPDLAIMCARENNDPTKGMYVAFKGGSNGTTHNHNDLGTVVVYYNGKPVLIDMGACNYTKVSFGPKRYELTPHSASYHNTADINGVAQAFGSPYVTKNESYDAREHSAVMDITDAYPKGAGLESYVRKTALTDGQVIVSDSFALAEEGEIDIHFLTHERPEISEGNTIKLAEGRTLIYQDGLTPRIEVFPAYDERIAKNWADELYNIHLKAKIKSGSFVTVIK